MVSGYGAGRDGAWKSRTAGELQQQDQTLHCHDLAKSQVARHQLETCWPASCRVKE